MDDAFIVYRYVRNLGRGDGFVFNLGERVEGVTCFLWTLVLTPLSAAGLALPRVAPVLTAIAGLCCLVVVARRHAESAGRSRLALRDLLPSALLAFNPAFAYWSVGALETVHSGSEIVRLDGGDRIASDARSRAETRKSSQWRSVLWRLGR